MKLENPETNEFPVDIVPVPQYLGQRGDRFAFAYTIHITNQGEQTITLLNRHWIITHGDGGSEEVIGEGVLGEQPELLPGGSFSYTSGAVMPTRSGSMQGSYGFSNAQGTTFRVAIPEFALHAPDSLH